MTSLRETAVTLKRVMQMCTAQISQAVNFGDVRASLIPIFPPIDIERAEGVNKTNTRIMCDICDCAGRLSLEDFVKFVNVLDENHQDVASLIRKKYKTETGHQLDEALCSSSLRCSKVPTSTSHTRELSPISKLFESPFPQTCTSISSGSEQSVHSKQNTECKRISGTYSASVNSTSFRSSQLSRAPAQMATLPSSFNPNELESARANPGNLPSAASSEAVRGSTGSITSTGQMSELSEVRGLYRVPLSKEVNLEKMNITLKTKGKDVLDQPSLPVPNARVSAASYRGNQFLSQGSGIGQPPSPSLCSRKQSPSQVARSYQGSSATMLTSTTQCKNFPVAQNPAVSRHSPNYPRGIVPDSTTGPMQIKYQKKYRKEPNEVYKMETDPRGFALIINNVDFDYCNKRNGSDFDMTKVCNAFKYLGFKVSFEKNQSGKQMLELLEKFAKYDPLKGVSALVVIILSHGMENDVMLGTDGNIKDGLPVSGTYITKQQLMQIFKTRNCPHMAGKPKLFILQACRGEFEDKLHTSSKKGRSTNSLMSNDSPDFPLESDGPKLVPPKTDVRAETADMCFVHAASLGYKAYRQKSQGSPFIELFMKCLVEQACNKEFRDIIQEVQRTLSENRLVNDAMTLPDYSNQFVKKLYFNPPFVG